MWDTTGNILISGAENGQFIITDLQAQQQVVIDTSLERIFDVAISPDDSQVAVAGINAVEVYDIATGELMQRIDFDGAVFTVAWKPDSNELFYGGRTDVSGSDYESVVIGE